MSFFHLFVNFPKSLFFSIQNKLFKTELMVFQLQLKSR
jgi:hypothetical protein